MQVHTNVTKSFLDIQMVFCKQGTTYVVNSKQWNSSALPNAEFNYVFRTGALQY